MFVEGVNEIEIRFICSGDFEKPRKNHIRLVGCGDCIPALQNKSLCLTTTLGDHFLS